MFKLHPGPEFTAAVPVSVPGLPEPLDVQITFRHKTKDALKAWMLDAEGKTDAAVLHQIIVSWSGVYVDGQQVPYSLTALTDLLGNYSVAHLEIQRGYLRELTEAKKKIS